MSIKDKKVRLIIEIVTSVILLGIIILLTWFLNQKVDVTFDFNNNTKNKVVQVRKNKTINEKDIKNKDDLGENFVNWYEVIDVKDEKEILAEKPFDFNTKITKNLKLKAVYETKVESITIKFDSKGGGKIDDIILNKNETLKLPKNPVKQGYKFIVWQDKNGTPIHENALFAEDTTLYAKWEKIENKKPENTEKEPEKPKEIIYYCDQGYELEGTKCTKTVSETASIITSCESPYNLKIDNMCININVKTDLIKTCKKYNGYEGVVAQGAPLCFYNPLSEAPDYATCRSRYHYNNNVGFYNNKCYENKFGSDYITYGCPDGYSQFYPSATSNPVCGKSTNAKKNYVCDSGYSLKGKNCVKTIVIDAKQK